MSERERTEFRLFCQLATDRQLEHIVAKEQAAAEGSDYRAACAGIAESIASERGIL